MKETWHALEIGDAYATAYRADMPPGSEKYDRWNSPIHMPRWASRLTLEITEVRVERVQAIGEVAARAEGVDREAWPEDITNDDATLNAECGYFPPRFYVAGFARRWDALNARRSGGAFSWQRNPWVWSISFRQLS